MVVIGFEVGAWVWDQTWPPILGRSSSFGWGRGRDRGLCSRDCTLYPVWFYPSWTFGSLSSFSPSPQHPQFLKVVGTKGICLGISTWVSEYKPSGKLAILLFQVQNFCSVNYTLSCVPVAKVNHVIPFLSIMWKSKGSFFIKHLILFFVLEFNCNNSW